MEEIRTDEQIRIDRIEEKADKALQEVSMLKTLVSDMDRRVIAQEKVIDKFYESTGEIKALLNGNTEETKSAKNNARGWGFLSVFVSVIFKLGEIILRSKVAL